MQAQTIDEVIKFLDDIIEEAKENQSPIGYFPALYRKVTQKVKEGIESGQFENGPRMEKLDVLFANRYLEAYQKFKSGGKPTQSWQIAFEKTGTYWPIVLQHLLWGINAHINLDLGIAAAETAEGTNLESLKADFDKINHVLASLVKEVEEELSQIWPTLKYLLVFTEKVDDFFINFSMKQARDGAWKFANEYYHTKPEVRKSLIDLRDQKISEIAAYVNPPGWISKTILKIIRLGERSSVREKIMVLA